MTRVLGLFATLAMLAALSVDAASAREADVVAARATCDADRVCSFSVTVKHPDIGWSHYVDRFEVLGPDGGVLGVRVLRHPHVHEQPFTRTLAGVEIPEGVTRVTVRAHDTVDGYGGRSVEVALGFGEAAEAGADGEAAVEP